MADCVDATFEAMKAADPNPVMNRTSVEAEVMKLTGRDPALLAPSQLSNRLVNP